MSVDHIWLEKNFFKEHLNDKQKQIVCKQFETVHHKKGETIIFQGQTCETIYIMYKGCASISCNTKNESIQIGTIQAGGLVGEMSFISETTTSATVVALEDCILFKLSKVAFSQMRQQDKGLVNLTFMNLLQHTANIIRQMNVKKVRMQKFLTDSQF